MKLKQIGEKTYYIKNDTNIGVYLTGEDRVCLIDTGSAGDGEAIDEILRERGWKLDFIINTHTHIDHLGGNAYLMEKYGAPAYCTDVDMAFAHYTDLEAAYMNGGRSPAKLRRIFRHPGKLGFRAIDGDGDGSGIPSLPGISWEHLPGHTFGMIGVRTEDDIWFSGDAYLSREYLNTHRFGYLCDVGEYLNTLDRLKAFEGKLFVPSHGIAELELAEITDLNRENVLSIAEAVRRLCRNGASLDTILQGMYREFGMKNNIANHALLSSTIKCYITWLQDAGKLGYGFENDIMIWRATD